MLAPCGVPIVTPEGPPPMRLWPFLVLPLPRTLALDLDARLDSGLWTDLAVQKGKYQVLLFRGVRLVRPKPRKDNPAVFGRAARRSNPAKPTKSSEWLPKLVMGHRKCQHPLERLSVPSRCAGSDDSSARLVPYDRNQVLDQSAGWSAATAPHTASGVERAV